MWPRRPRTHTLRDLTRRAASRVDHKDAIRIENPACVLEDDLPAVGTPAWIERPRGTTHLEQRCDLARCDVVDAQLALAVFAGHECQLASIRREDRIACERAALDDATRGAAAHRLLPQEARAHHHDPLTIA